MKNLNQIKLHGVAASIALILSSASGHATCLGGTVVTNCADSGVGSLRSVIGCANDSNTINMANLTCSEISLTTGEIVVPQNNLVIQGAGTRISGQLNGNSRVLNHTGTGVLELAGLYIVDGHYVGSSANGSFYGGCIRSEGSVQLIESTVAGCVIHGTGGAGAAGGGIFANAGITESFSHVTGNSAIADSGAPAEGGGLATPGPATIYYSTISNNSGGGLVAITLIGNVDIINSTISGNQSSSSAGGVRLEAKTAIINSSTISGNYSLPTAGGLLVTASTNLQIHNSTIAFNKSQNSAAHTSGGLQFYSGVSLTVDSTIMSNNVAGGEANDLYVGAGVAFAGGNNLIYAFAPDQGTAAPVNFGLPVGTCPLLAPLADNGFNISLTPTHALLSGSPALGKGSNPENFAADQRGTPFPRTSTGDFGFVFTDIGAYEVQRADIVFNTGFDGCP
jgi:hypothetical protein